MRLRASTVLADAWAAWRTDWTILTAIAGAFLFLPQLALLLLVPALPDLPPITSSDPNDPGVQAALTIIADWLSRYGGWHVLVVLVAMFGQFAIVACYVLPERPSVGRALVTALTLSWRFILATIAWMLPLGMAQFLTLAVVPLLYFPITALVSARMLLVGPAILAERPIGALAAIGRSVRATRGNMLMLATVILGLVIAQYLLTMPTVLADQWMALHAPNPVARAIVDVATSAVLATGGIALALIQVAAWRRLG
ncbi:MAG: hypothetical protein J0I47_00530 [Sphingomonas sp.]|uniref:hypothetical protein n=1 Tax=Sphingomonas sp. TaxID=28214 RepID=UPI001ACA8FDC|nr:hypothetical protein [Sphingomonas sp.]MBN8806714.1 hypothetical protein [Sphingomonas sp.]